MKTAANFLLGLGTLMLIAYTVIGFKGGAGLIHSPFVMLPAGIILLIGGIIGRFVLPRM